MLANSFHRLQDRWSSMRGQPSQKFCCGELGARKAVQNAIRRRLTYPGVCAVQLRCSSSRVLSSLVSLPSSLSVLVVLCPRSAMPTRSFERGTVLFLTADIGGTNSRMQLYATRPNTQPGRSISDSDVDMGAAGVEGQSGKERNRTKSSLGDAHGIWCGACCPLLFRADW
jgi:hypothetical protein